MPTSQPTIDRDLMARIDAAISPYAMLSHPFYKAWNSGELDRSILQKYSQQYFAQVKAFPTYVSAVHSQCEDLDLRRALLENLIEEERGAENHPELWLRFAEGLGLDREAVCQADLLDSTQDSVRRLKELTRNFGPVAGLSALYAYESQIPGVAQSKREGLKAFYELDDARAVEFFTVHEKADIWHSDTERLALSKLCNSSDEKDAAVAAAEEGARALWTFLDGVMAAYAPECQLA